MKCVVHGCKRQTVSEAHGLCKQHENQKVTKASARRQEKRLEQKPKPREFVNGGVFGSFILVYPESKVTAEEVAKWLKEQFEGCDLGAVEIGLVTKLKSVWQNQYEN